MTVTPVSFPLAFSPNRKLNEREIIGKARGGVYFSVPNFGELDHMSF